MMSQPSRCRLPSTMTPNIMQTHLCVQWKITYESAKCWRGDSSQQQNRPCSLLNALNAVWSQIWAILLTKMIKNITNNFYLSNQTIIYFSLDLYLTNILTMLNIRNAVKISRNIYSRRYLFNTGIAFSKSTSFPYKFGGLSQFQLSLIFSQQYSQINQQFMKAIFDQNILNNFAVAYRNIIKGLHQKDKEYLSNLLQKNLTKDIVFPETELLNPESQIEVKVGKMNTVVYGRFDRQYLSQYYIRQIKKTKDQQQTTHMALSKTEPTVYKTSLFCFHVYFKSAMKLKLKENDQTNLQSQQIKNNNLNDKQKSNNSQKEIHMVQFEIQSKMSIGSLIKNALRIIYKNGLNMNKMSIQYARSILGIDNPDFQWKIGDIDRVLQGNFTQAIKEKQK